MTVLADRLLAVHGTLDAAGVPHAFGGAIALAYCTQEPRGTRDLDINVFTEPMRAGEVFAALPPEVVVSDGDVATAVRDGQVRLWWGETPLDFFFDVDEFHHEIAAAVRLVPFLDHRIPVLGCTALVVFKALYNRTKDWADIEAMLEVGTVDRDEALRWMNRLLGRDDPATARLAALCADGRFS